MLHRHYLFDIKFMFIEHCIYESSRFLVKTGSGYLCVMGDDERIMLYVYESMFV